MVRSSVVSAVSSACEIRLVPDWRCFWSTNSKRSSSRKAPGSLATPCVDESVLSPKKAEQQEPRAALAAARSARRPEHAIANFLATFFSRDLQSRAGRSEPIARNKRTAVAVRHRAAKIRRSKAGRAEGRQGRAPRGTAARGKTPRTCRRAAAKTQKSSPPPPTHGHAPRLTWV